MSDCRFGVSPVNYPDPDPDPDPDMAVVYSYRYFVGPLYMHLLYYRLGSFEKALFHLAKKRFV